MKKLDLTAGLRYVMHNKRKGSWGTFSKTKKRM